MGSCGFPYCLNQDFHDYRIIRIREIGAINILWNSAGISDVVSYLCRSRSPDLDLFAMGRLQTPDVGDLNRLGVLEEKLDKCVYAWYNLM